MVIEKNGPIMVRKNPEDNWQLRYFNQFVGNMDAEVFVHAGASFTNTGAGVEVFSEYRQLNEVESAVYQSAAA